MSQKDPSAHVHKLLQGLQFPKGIFLDQGSVPRLPPCWNLPAPHITILSALLPLGSIALPLPAAAPGLTTPRSLHILDHSWSPAADKLGLNFCAGAHSSEVLIVQMW